MSDPIEIIGRSVIQHGKFNDRVYLMKLDPTDLPEILGHLNGLAEQHHYSKIFAKVPRSAQPDFEAEGYLVEAQIPRFYDNRDDVVFFGKYFAAARGQEQKPELVRKVLHAAEGKKGRGGKTPLREPFVSRAAKAEDVDAMAEVYRQVFATYPFPIHDPEYLQRTMEENVAYFAIWHGDRMVALSSAEMDVAGRNAEMTDFATLPDYRGKGLANYLLAGMENTLEKHGISTAYTIARAYSYGMNITFARQDYSFSGTLTNNTNISGGLESMNVWYKPVKKTLG